MLYNILFILLIGGASLGATFAFGSTNEPETQSPPAETRTTAGIETVGDLSQEQDGIEVTIEKIEQREDGTALLLNLSNHQYDLAQETIFTLATLNDRPSKSFTLLSNASGGHHVEAEIVFEKTTEGTFEITPAAGTTFTFEKLW